ncbi:hypothetical protein OG921_25415 [Aldersonia sp. NBC_00410]|uniref:hypothetical protein n=1 Tax=Aldersonia sp. NBC_00410 TaxID=2975954 RepID=UPI0022502DBF|nr:hypothetical protein [Aldersonia sp. NBC_00410]MCX5046515.1 hypothetical protein [Aldersonia sp. NBC_00410]
MQDPKVLDTPELEPTLANLRKARDAASDEGAGGTDVRELDRAIAAVEIEIRRRHEEADGADVSTVMT